MENSESGSPERKNSEERSLEEVKKEVDFLTEFTEKLQKSFNVMEDTVKKLNKTMELLTEKVENNNKFMQKTLRELRTNVEDNGVDTEMLTEQLENGKIEMKPREEVDETNFLDALLKILAMLKKEVLDKEYAKITTTRKRFKEDYSISDEQFDEFLLKNHWNGNIELRPGTGKHSIKDHYGNVYHNINFKAKENSVSDID